MGGVLQMGFVNVRMDGWEEIVQLKQVAVAGNLSHLDLIHFGIS